jgi:hypothetical protein
MLYCLLFADEYVLDVKETSYQINFDKIRERYFREDNASDHMIREPLPDGVIKRENNLIRFVSDDVRHNVMYGFVTECLVEESDLEFFLVTASSHVIKEYCRSWFYEKNDGERCLYIPETPQEMYDLFIDKLQLDIITHCTMTDPYKRIHEKIHERCKYDYQQLLEAIPNCIFVKRQRAGRFFCSTLPKINQHFPNFWLDLN